ncbi:MAG: hypothetical protein V2J65_34395 [Desulfobacteraceae bacterium]|jgi:hypothetical protein|nr:hypothetical protein [Desulfobacteraceae bacterium]
MPGEFDKKHLKFWTPATYHIEVEGVLDEIWTDSLAGMRISTRKRADQSTVMTLTGRLKDQAELSGVLNGLYELHLPILSVEILSEDNDAQKDPDKPAKRQGKAVTT